MTANASPDIIDEIAPGIQEWTWVESIEITRQGTVSMPNVAGLEDAWQISVPIRASLATDGQVIMRGGQEIQTQPTIRRSQKADVALLLHDAEVQQALPLLRSIALRLVRGDLIPQQPQA